MIDLYNISISVDGDQLIARCGVCDRIVMRSDGELLPDIVEEVQGHLRSHHAS